VRIPSILFFPLEAQVHRTVKDSVTISVTFCPNYVGRTTRAGQENSSPDT
jgi:hypothetical protein